MKSLSLVAIFISGSLLFSVPAFAEEEHATAAPDAKHEVKKEHKKAMHKKAMHKKEHHKKAHHDKDHHESDNKQEAHEAHEAK